MSLLVIIWIVSAVTAVLISPAPASGQRQYEPGTPPWVPLIDECMAAGGSRNDCIAALPPDVYAALTDWERKTREQRRALMRIRLHLNAKRSEDCPDRRPPR